MEKETNHALNTMLVKLFNTVMLQEEKAIITEEFKDITNNDMHIIEAVGIDEPRSMSTVAKKYVCYHGNSYDQYEQFGR